MAGVRVLEATRIAAEVERLIDEADEFLILVSPFARLWNDIEDCIIAAHEHGVDTKMVVCKDRHVSRELVREKVTVLVAPPVHAKLYVNEKEAILTSYNLTSHAEDSIECGVLIPRSADSDAYDAALAQARRAVELGAAPESGGSRGRRGRGRSSDDRRGPSRDTARDPSRDSGRDAPREPAADEGQDDGGRRGGSRERDAFCISCGDALRFDRERPHCRACFDDNAEGGRCHACGKESRTDRRRPLCRDCFDS